MKNKTDNGSISDRSKTVKEDSTITPIKSIDTSNNKEFYLSHEDGSPLKKQSKSILHQSCTVTSSKDDLGKAHKKCSKKSEAMADKFFFTLSNFPIVK